MKHRFFATVCALALLGAAAAAAEVPAVVPRSELQALDRAIARELNVNELGSQTLGDLQRLRHRLETMAPTARTDRQTALEPLASGDESMQGILAKLQEAAKSGKRNDLRTLALYQMFLNNPEEAKAAWQQMGPANNADLPFLLLSGYLNLSLGEYNTARANLESAQRVIDSRTSLELSNAVFCDNIVGYRLYAPRPAREILPGESTLIYVEVEGAEFVSLPDGDSECRIMFGLRLVNDLGRVLWAEPNFGEYNPAFAGPIRDLHTALTWRVPNDLEPGLYRLHIEAVERTSNRRGETVMEFTVARRDTNPVKRPTGMTPDMEKTVKEAQRSFPGGPQEFNVFSNEELKNRAEHQLEILRQNERMQGGGGR